MRFLAHVEKCTLGKPSGTRIKEHKEACQSCSLDKSAIAEHAWTEHHPIQWDNIKILDKANRQDLLRIKEAVHIQLKDEGERVNRDIGRAVPYCWIAMLKLFFLCIPPHLRMPTHVCFVIIQTDHLRGPPKTRTMDWTMDQHGASKTRTIGMDHGPPRSA